MARIPAAELEYAGPTTDKGFTSHRQLDNIGLIHMGGLYRCTLFVDIRPLLGGTPADV